MILALEMTTKDDFRLVIPYVEFSKQNRGVRPMVLDTSALVDGRILDVAAAGVLERSRSDRRDMICAPSSSAARAAVAEQRGFVLQEHALSLYANCTKTDCPHKGHSHRA